MVELQGYLSEGAAVASKIEVEGLEDEEESGPAEFNFEGSVEELLLDGDQNVVGVVVDGQTIAIEALTDLGVELHVGVFVEVRGIFNRGVLLASRIKGERSGRRSGAEGAEEEEEERPGGPQTPEARLKIEGTIDAVELDESGRLVAVTVDGEVVTVTGDTRIRGEVAEGREAELRVTYSDGILEALSLNVEGPSSEETTEPDGSGEATEHSDDTEAPQEPEGSGEATEHSEDTEEPQEPEGSGEATEHSEDRGGQPIQT